MRSSAYRSLLTRLRCARVVRPRQRVGQCIRQNTAFPGRIRLRLMPQKGDNPCSTGSNLTRKTQYPLQFLYGSILRDLRIRHSPCLRCHIDQNLSGFRRTADLPQECDARSTRTVLGFQAYMKAQTIN